MQNVRGPGVETMTASCQPIPLTVVFVPSRAAGILENVAKMKQVRDKQMTEVTGILHSLTA